MTRKQRYVPHAWETVVCPFCGSNKIKLHEKYGPELQYTYVKCLGCKLIYQSPRPKFDEVFIRDAYSHYHLFKPDHAYSVNEAWKKEIDEILRFDKLKTSILDVGSAMGDFLYFARDYYRQCYGLEISENMARYTEEKLGMKVYVGHFLETSFDLKFSCIHLSHVIEHVPDPAAWIEKCKSILEKDGVLALSVPHMQSLDRKFKLFLKRTGLRKGNWKDASRTPDHLFEPTIPSTIKFLKSNGFKVLEYYTYSRKDMDARTPWGIIYNRWLKLGSNLRFFVTPE